MRVAVMGAGGTGGYFGGVLARGGEDVTFIARGAHLEAIQRDGLRVRSLLDGEFSVQAEATDDAASIGEVDFVIFSVKMYDTRDAAELIRPLVGPGTLIASTQNGIDAERLIGETVGHDHVLGATATVSSIIPEPGVIDQRGGPGTLLLGEMAGGSSERLDRLVAALKAAGVRADSHDDIRTALWQKFMFICGLSGMTTLTRLTIGEILAHEASTRLLKDCMMEVIEVAKASGVGLGEQNAGGAVKMLGGVGASVKGSMTYDLEAGRRLELASLNGKVAELGEQLGVQTPVNVVINSALAPYENGAPTSI